MSDLISQYQPANDSNRRRRSSLSQLEELGNVDKHREIPLLCAAPIGWIGTSPDLPSTPQVQLKNNAVLARFPKGAWQERFGIIPSPSADWQGSLISIEDCLMGIDFHVTILVNDFAKRFFPNTPVHPLPDS
ncbi:MAG: hypothetical protein ACKVVT_05910 [Dehalococcoidia bacterium]